MQERDASLLSPFFWKTKNSLAQKHRWMCGVKICYPTRWIMEKKWYYTTQAFDEQPQSQFPLNVQYLEIDGQFETVKTVLGSFHWLLIGY